MSFDLENAVQQGFSRDIDTNDWHVEARNLEIKLEDAAGTNEFRVLDSDNTAILVADSDGYLSTAGVLEVHGGNVLIESQSVSGTNAAYVTLKDTVDEIDIVLFDGNPDGAVTGKQGSFGTSYGDGYLYINADGATKWERIAYTSQISSAALDTTTLQRAYDNDPDGGNAVITTNTTDGSVVIAGTETLQVTTSGGIDLDTGFDMDGAGPFDVNITGAISLDSDSASDFTVDGANLTLRTISSGNVNVIVPGDSGNFTVSDGSSDYIRTHTSGLEVRLGDGSGTEILTRVMQDMVVTGDLTVNGNTTYVNTADLLVEDNLIRLNRNAPAAFNGTVGFEAETGSDGYVQFHWDDSQSRWELSIDRNTTPGSQTFRPLAYLADSPATLDLSDLGADGYAPHNATAGASVVNTNRTNFPDTFGPLMIDDSVQSALEAIDGYFKDGVTVDRLNLCTVDGSTYSSIQDMHNLFNSAGSVTGGTITDAGSDTIDVTSGSGFIRAVNDSLEALCFFDWPASTGLSIPDDTIRYVGVEYNAGSPQVVVKTSETWNLNTEFPLGTVLNEDGYIHIEPSPHKVGDSAGQIIRRLVETMHYERDDRQGGLVIGETGSRNVTLSAGAIWTRLNRIAITGKDTSASDIFRSYYRDGGSGHVVSFETQWPNDAYDDGSGTLFPLPAGKYTNLWWYMGLDQHLYMQYGRAAYDTVAEALAEGSPSSDLPLVLQEHSLFIGRFVICEGESTTNVIQTPWEDVIGTANVTDHGALTGLGDDDHVQYILANGTRPLTAPWTTVFKIITPEIEYTGTLTLDGTTGIVLDGNGSNVVPATDDTDTLGSASFGWADIFMTNVAGTASVALGEPGSVGTPNTTSGAAAIGTESDNFADTFGSSMTEDSVQAALEAIDGYLATLSNEISTVEGTATLQVVYDNDPNGGDATITTNATDGSVVIAGTESLQVAATGGLDLDTGFDMDGAGPFDVDITSGFSIDADAASNITVDGANLDLGTTTSGAVNIDGASGITLEGNGADVTPGTNNTDTLGSSSLGWADIYLQNVSDSGNVSLNSAGGASAPNTTSGASAVGTNSSNFSTFGGDMGENSVQSALEAIDGYLQSLSIDGLIDSTFTDVKGLDINGAVLNGVVKISTDAGTPALDFKKSSTSRAIWSIPVPTNWDGASDIDVEIVWSPQTSGAGNVEWRLEYKSLALTELASTAAVNVDYTQAAGGTADAIQTTGTNLAIPAAAIDETNDEIIVLSLVRRGGAAGDTYDDNAQVHLVKYSYSAENII